MAEGFKHMMAEANAKIATISVQEALDFVGADEAVFVDVRETVERQANGAIQGSVHAPRGFLEFIADPEGPMHDEVFASGKKLILYCASGGRSSLAALTLEKMGIEQVINLVGGYAAWVEAGGPTET